MLPGPTYSYVYDDANRLVETSDPAGRETNNYYDFRNRLIKVEAPDPNPDDNTTVRPTTEYFYDAADRLEYVVDPLGRRTDYSYDNLNRLTEVLLPEPDVGVARSDYSYKYDAVGNRIETIDSVNRKTTVSYDNLYRPTTLTDPDGQAASSKSIKSFTLSKSLSQAQSNDWVVTYNDQLQIASITDPESKTTTRGYDDAGRLTSSTDPLLNETSYTYDLLNRTKTVTLPDPDALGSGQDESVMTYVYDAFSRVTSIIDDAGTTDQAYDLAGNLISLTDAENNTTYWAYDALGRKTHETDQLGYTASFVFNSVDRMVRKSDKNGDVTWFTHEGYVRSERWFEYDGTLPTLTITSQDGGSGTDEIQTVTLNDLNDGVFRLAFGGSSTGNIDHNISGDNLEDKLEALPGIESGDLDIQRNGNVFTITFEGSLAGMDVPQLLGDVMPDSDGNEIRTMNFTFDAGNRLLSTEDKDSNQNDLSSNYSFLYDNLDRVTDQTENIVGLTPEVFLEYSYDLVGRRTSMNATLGGVADYQNTYQYDALDRPWQITQQGDAAGNSVAYKRTKFVYNHLGDITYINRYETTSNSVGLRTVLTYDGANRLDTLTHRANIQSNAPVLSSYDFEYDNMSRLIEIDSSWDGVSTFTFDTTSQLTNANHASIANENYTYDATGNRDVSSGYTVGDNNRTESDGTYNYEYDGEGNRVRRTEIATGDFEIYDFDHRNRLTKISAFDVGDNPISTIGYTYDVYNRLVHRSHDSNADGTSDRDDFFAGFDGDNPTLHFQVTDNADAEATDLKHRYLWGPFIDMLMAEEDVTSVNTEGQVLWTLTDHLGTVRDIGKFESSSGQFEVVNHRIYNSFGKFDSETNSTYSLDFGFTGKWTDSETGMTHHIHRWYDPVIGKWISEDPIGFDAGDANISRYVGNNPLQFTDPNGLAAAGSGGAGGGYGGHSYVEDDASHGGKQKPQKPGDTNVKEGKNKVSTDLFDLDVIYKPNPTMPNGASLEIYITEDKGDKAKDYRWRQHKRDTYHYKGEAKPSVGRWELDPPKNYTNPRTGKTSDDADWYWDKDRVKEIGDPGKPLTFSDYPNLGENPIPKPLPGKKPVERHTVEFRLELVETDDIDQKSGGTTLETFYWGYTVDKITGSTIHTPRDPWVEFAAEQLLKDIGMPPRR